MATNNLAGSSLRPRGFCLLALRLGHFALCARLLSFNLFAGVVVADFITRPTGDLRASIAFRSEPVLTDQRTHSRRFFLYGLERVNAGNFGVQLQTRMLVEQIEGP